LLAVLVINVVTFVMMVAASFLSGSSALLSGTLDNFGDAVTYALSFAVVGASAQAKARVASFAAALDLAANSICLYLLNPFKTGDVNMSSAWECSRNDVIEGGAVIATTITVALLGSAWPDIIVAIALLAMFLRSAIRVLGTARRGLLASSSPVRGSPHV
jgi:Co/Zn/Cd efflux system component